MEISGSSAELAYAQFVQNREAVSEARAAIEQQAKARSEDFRKIESEKEQRHENAVSIYV